MENQQSENAALIEYVSKQGAKIEHVEFGAVKVPLVVRQDGAVGSLKAELEKYREFPERTKGMATLGTVDSFIEHVERFKRVNHSAVFADPTPKAPKLLSVLDYSAIDNPRYAEHRGQYLFPLSEQWKAWTAMHRKDLTQTEFAEFIEDNIPDLIDFNESKEGVRKHIEKLNLMPASPAEVLELGKGLAIFANTEIVNHQNLRSGEGRIVFKEEHRDATGAPIKVPAGFIVRIPVCVGGIAYELCVRLRYRVSGQTTTWQMVLFRTDLVFRDAFNDACKLVGEKTGVPLFMGSPEV